jgi:predicted transcriptional regulator
MIFRRKLTPEQRQAARELINNSDMSINEIAEELGVKPHQIQYLKKKQEPIDRQLNAIQKTFTAAAKFVETMNQSAINNLKQKLEFQELQEDLQEQLLGQVEENTEDSFESMIIQLIKPYMPQIIQAIQQKQNGQKPPETQETKPKYPTDPNQVLRLISLIPEKVITKKGVRNFIKTYNINPDILKKATKNLQKISKVV